MLKNLQKFKKITAQAIILMFVINFFSYSASGQLDDYQDNAEIKKLNNEIQARQDLIKKKKDEQEALKQALAQKQDEKADLTNQLAILDNRLEKARLDIESTQAEIDKTDLEIKKTELEIDDKTKQISDQKEYLAKVVNLMRKQDEVSPLETLMLNDSLSEFLSQIKYLEDINGAVKVALDKLFILKSQLEEQLKISSQKKEELNSLKNDLINKTKILESEKESKNFILEETKSSEVEYQRLLKIAKAEQEQAASDIYSLEKTAREKMSQMQKEKLQFNDAGLMWPVPKNTITAYFHDPDYPFRNIFEHPAIDIRAPQGTPLHAAASGYVARAKNAGMGYSYIMIVHGNGLSTVYGHVSKISVKEDEYVTQGQVIGASGGMPGTPGAGGLTTGPHLHFEARLNGIPVNPLEYLP